MKRRDFCIDRQDGQDIGTCSKVLLGSIIRELPEGKLLMNQKSVTIFKILAVISILLMILASAIASAKGIYLIWLMPLIFVFEYVVAFYVCRYVQSMPEKTLRRRLIIQLGGILIPNFMFNESQLGQFRDLLVNIVLIGIAVFTNLFVILLLVGVITQ